MSLFTRYIFICICQFYIFSKIANWDFRDNRHRILLFFVPAFAIPLFISVLQLNNSYFRMIILFILSLIYLIYIINTNTRFAFTTLVIALGLSFVFYILSGTITSMILLLIYKSYEYAPRNRTPIYTGIIQFIITVLLFKSSRLYNGLRVFIKSKHILVGSIPSIVLVGIISYISYSKYSTSQPIRKFILTFLIVLSIMLIFYWRHRITQTYREKLRQANEKSMLDEINEHKLTIDKLTADNKRLASIVHADNKLVPAMLTAVTEHLENRDNLTLDELTEHGHELSEQLRSMAKDREGILNQNSKDAVSLPKSGLHTVDGMISFMETRAKEFAIAYKVTVSDNIKEMATNTLSEEDLLRLLGDLIDNAIIATKHSDKEKAILIHMGSLHNHFLLEISDSGIPFTLETYQRFGNEQHTTHKDTGGSGIGLMDIWKIKKKYRASLHIYEYPDSYGIYTKKMSFVFDRKNHFLLQTDRHKEITRELTRGDLYIFPYKSE